MVCAGSDVADLRRPVLRELMLHAQVPFHDSGDEPLGAGGLDGSENMDGIAGWNRCRETGRDELRGSRELSWAKVLRHKCDLGRVLTEIIKDIRFRRVEHPECASDNSVLSHRPSKAKARSPIVLIELHAAV